MATGWEVRVFENRQPVFEALFAGTLEMGRQDKGEDAPYFLKTVASGRARLIVARLDEDRIPRQHVVVEPQSDGKVLLSNPHKLVPVRLESGPMIQPGASAAVMLPFVLLMGPRAVRIQASAPPAEELHSLPEATSPPFTLLAGHSSVFRLADEGPLQVESFVRWLQAAMGVLHSAAHSLEFYERAARAVVELVGLDSCRVLLREKGTWRIQAAHTAVPDKEGDWRPSRKILDRVLQDKRTFWELPSSAENSASLIGVRALVAAPILNRQAEVIGVLYGDRAGKGDRRSISRLEALLVELLAGGVAAGLARVEQEQAALRARVQFEQFFTPELSRQLLDKPELLDGKSAEVSVLFCDIRGFSRITERLGPTRTIEWTGHVLGALSECVRAEQGVLVDYVGDELMAMWGAPEPQPDHARRACRAALAMLAQVPALNDKWRSTIDEPMGLAIGVNTGEACVGNIGSAIKFKYGPRGNAVNIASRAQGVNKQLKTSILITQNTQAQLGGSLPTRRLCQVRMVNIAEPVTLFELAAAGQPRWDELRGAYENALQMFEQKKFREAARILGKLLAEFPQDGPSLVLMSRAVERLVEDTANFDPVWEMKGK